MKKQLGLFGIIFAFAFNSCGSSSSPIDLKPREYSLDIPEISITVNGAHIPDRSDPEYKNYCPAVLDYLEGESHYQDNEGRVRIRGTSSRWFKKKAIRLSSLLKSLLEAYLLVRNLIY